MMHVSAHHHLENIQRDLMAVIEQENAARKASARLSAVLHGDSSTYPNYEWTDTPPELLKAARETVQVRGPESGTNEAH